MSDGVPLGKLKRLGPGPGVVIPPPLLSLAMFGAAVCREFWLEQEDGDDGFRNADGPSLDVLAEYYGVMFDDGYPKPTRDIRETIGRLCLRPDRVELGQPFPTGEIA